MPVGMVIKMSYLEEMRPEHYPELYEVLREHDPTFAADSLDHMIACFQELEGWVVIKNDRVVGMVVFSGYQPRLNLIIHAVVRSDWRGRWMTKDGLRLVFGHAYNDLDVPKVSGYMVDGLNASELWPIFKKIGFTIEGNVRKGFLHNGKYYDLYPVGMLREECRWIK